MLKKNKTLIVLLFFLIPFKGLTQNVVSINDLLNDTAFVKKLPLPMASITTNAEQTEKINNEAKIKLNISPEELLKVDSILNVFNEKLISSQEHVSEEFLNTSNAIVLDEFGSDLKQTDEKVSDYISIIQSRIHKLEIENKRLTNLKTIWDVTLKSDRISELSDAIISKLKGVIQDLDSTNIKIQKALNYLVELELKFNDLNQGFDNLLNLVSEARDTVSKNFLIPDSAPLWNIYFDRKDTVDIQTKLRTLISERKSVLSEYYQNYKSNIFLGLLILFIIQILFFAIRYQILKEQILDQKQLKNTFFRILKTPFFPALLIGLYIFYLSLPQSPIILDKLLYLFALIPFIFILMQVVLDINRFLVFILFLILFFTNVSIILFDIEILSRSLMLIINVSALIWILIVMKMHIMALDNHPFLRGGIKFLVRVSLVVLVLCLIGNVIGYYTLTSILLSGILSTAFLGITLYFINLLINGVFVAILNTSWGQHYRIIKVYRNNIIVKIQRFLIFILTILFLAGALNGFFILDDVTGWIKGFLNTLYHIGDFTFTLGDIILFIFILLMTSWISKFILFILKEQVFFKSKKQRDLSASISSLVKFAILTIGFIIAAIASGFPLDRITLLISAFGVGIGFGLQNIFNNLVSGIILVFERPLQVGDIIEVGQLLGEVKTIGIRASTIRTFDGAEVIVPNGNLISNDLINWTLSDSQRRLTIKVGVEYGTDPNKVIKILKDVAKRNKDLLKKPEPYVLFREFGDSALGFELRCYTESENWLLVHSDLHVEVNNSLAKAGITIPFPQRDLHIKSMNPGIAKSIKTST